MSRESSLVAISVWTLLTAVSLDAAAAGEEVFVDRFDRQNATWRITHAGGDAPGIVRRAGDERPGLHFVTQGLAIAFAPWDIGTEPFELSFEIELDHGSRITCKYEPREVRVKLPDGRTVVFAETATGWKLAAPSEQ